MDEEHREALADGAYRALKEWLERPAFLDVIHDAITQGVSEAFPLDREIWSAIMEGVNSAFPFEWQITQAVENGTPAAMEER